MSDRQESPVQQQIKRHIAYEVERGRQIASQSGPKQQEQSQERRGATVIGLSTVRRGNEAEDPEQRHSRER